MVEILLRDNVAVFKPLGWSRIWTFSEPVSVLFSAIRAVRRAPAGVGRGWWKGWRIPGTHIPGIIVAGSYLDKGVWTFWDVRGAGGNAIEVELDGVRFKRLIVDVGDPDAQQQRLDNVITRRAS